MIKIFGDDLIEFYCRSDLYGMFPEPMDANKCVPDWFKKVKPYTPDKEPGGFKGMSVKKCLPVLDAMNLGYIIPLQGDVHVTTNYDLSVIKASNRENSVDMISNHPYVQVASESWPLRKHNPLKFINYWCIKTRPGWSVLFTAPLNHLGMPFTCMSGVVDTDKYPKEVNFPAVWHEPNFDDTLYAGTPLVQVIPFERKKLPKVKTRAMTDKEAKRFNMMQEAQKSRRSVYTGELREKR